MDLNSIFFGALALISLLVFFYFGRFKASKAQTERDNRPQWNKKKDEVEEVGTPSLSFFPSDPNLHKQEVLTNSPKYNYIAGILYPKETQYEETIGENSKTEEENELVEEKTEEKSNKGKKKIQKDLSQNNFEHDIADNEDPIDLTNEIKPSAMGSRSLKELTSVCSCIASPLPGLKGTLILFPAFFAAFSIPTEPPKTIKSAKVTHLIFVSNPFLILLYVLITLDNFDGLFTSQSF